MKYNKKETANKMKKNTTTNINVGKRIVKNKRVGKKKV